MPAPLGLLLLLGSLLRLYFSSIVGLNPDDSLRLTMVQMISFDPQHLYLPYWAHGLPLVGVYLLKLSHLLFGDSVLLLRLPWILAGVLTLFILYRLVDQALGHPQAILATFLLAVDQFHLTWTRTFYPEILVITAQAAFLTLLWKILCHPASPLPWFLLLGLLGGIGYHTKKLFLLTLLGSALYLLITGPLPQAKLPPKSKLLLTVSMLLLLILPAVVWETFHPMDSHYLSTRLTALEPGVRLSFTPLGLYLGELFHRFWPQSLEDCRSWHTYWVHWVAGVIYLAGVGWAWLRRRRDPFIAWMLICFFTASVPFFFLHTEGWVNQFRWVALGLIPVIVLAADGLTSLWQRSRWGRLGVLLLCIYLALHSLLSDYSGGLNEPIRSPEESTTLLVESGLEAMAHQQYGWAYDDFLWASKLDPNNGPLKDWLKEAFTLAYRQKIRP